MFYNRTNESYGGCHKKSIESRLKDVDENGLNSFQRASIKMVITRKKKNSFKLSKEKEFLTKKSKNYDDIKSKISNTLKGSKWVSKNGNKKYIKNSEYDKYILNGWISGSKYTISYLECSKIAKTNNIKTNIEWKKFSQKMNLPYNPQSKFKKEWISWNSFFGKEDNTEYTYEECVKIIEENKIRTCKEWISYARENKLPSHPERKFKKEWISWIVFLGKK